MQLYSSNSPVKGYLYCDGVTCIIQHPAMPRSPQLSVSAPKPPLQVLSKVCRLPLNQESSRVDNSVRQVADRKGSQIFIYSVKYFPALEQIHRHIWEKLHALILDEYLSLVPGCFHYSYLVGVVEEFNHNHSGSRSVLLTLSLVLILPTR